MKGTASPWRCGASSRIWAGEAQTCVKTLASQTKRSREGPDYWTARQQACQDAWFPAAIMHNTEVSLMSLTGFPATGRTSQVLGQECCRPKCQHSRKSLRKARQLVTDSPLPCRQSRNSQLTSWSFHEGAGGWWRTAWRATSSPRDQSPPICPQPIHLQMEDIDNIARLQPLEQPPQISLTESGAD